MRRSGGRPSQDDQSNWQLPEVMKRESDAQKLAFEKIAGPWMGRDKRRGVPYTWSVSHLSDARGQTSPRSFLAAIRQAVEDSRERYAQHEYALHYESIKRGIQKASEIRVEEMAEDYPWVREALSQLKGLNVPCDFDLVRQTWSEIFPQGLRASTQANFPLSMQSKGGGDSRRLTTTGID